MTIIKTNVPNDYYEILESVLGQLSDGMWENSRKMERYWMGIEIKQSNIGFLNIEVENIYYIFNGDKFVPNEIVLGKNLLKKYAECLKKLCAEYLKDNKTQADIKQYFHESGRLCRNWFNENNKAEIGYLKRKTYDVIIESDGTRKIDFDSGIYKDIFKVSDCKYVYDLLVG